jgi:hypothetical protein
VLARINTSVIIGPGDRGNRGIIMGSTRQDVGTREIGTPIISLAFDSFKSEYREVIVCGRTAGAGH